MVLSHTAQHSTVQHSTAQNRTAQHSTAPLGTAPHTLHMAQVLVADAGETLIGYTGMVIVAYYLRLSNPFASCCFPLFVYLHKYDIKVKRPYIYIINKKNHHKVFECQL